MAGAHVTEGPGEDRRLRGDPHGGLWRLQLHARERGAQPAVQRARGRRAPGTGHGPVRHSAPALEAAAPAAARECLHRAHQAALPGERRGGAAARAHGRAGHGRAHLHQLHEGLLRHPGLHLLHGRHLGAAEPPGGAHGARVPLQVRRTAQHAVLLRPCLAHGRVPVGGEAVVSRRLANETRSVGRRRFDPNAAQAFGGASPTVVFSRG